MSSCKLSASAIGLVALVVMLPSSGVSASQPHDQSKHPPKLLNYSKMTTKQLVDEGEKVIFGGIGQNKVEGAVGRGQCTLCHATLEGMLAERAPNLFGATKRASERLKDPRYHLGKPQERDTVQKEAFPGAGTATTPLEYIAETLICPSCYVPAGYGMRGTDDKDSPDINITKPPVSLKIDDLVAVTTWLYVHDGQRPPTPAKIVNAYRKFVTPHDWKYVTTIEPKLYVHLLATGEEPVEEIFRKATCVICHVIPGIPDATDPIGPAVRPVGPALTMKSVAPLRLKDPKYNGKATTTREYITESILYPSIYVTHGYPDNLMPKISAPGSVVWPSTRWSSISPRLKKAKSHPESTSTHTCHPSIGFFSFLRYHVAMPIDPDDPPIWLRKLHVTAAQISPSDYPATPEEGILQVCRLSDSQLVLTKAFRKSLESEPDMSSR